LRENSSTAALSIFASLRARMRSSGAFRDGADFAPAMVTTSHTLFRPPVEPPCRRVTSKRIHVRPPGSKGPPDDNRKIDDLVKKGVSGS
jgi:hypothetical protein